MQGLKIATFRPNVTPPEGHPLCGGWITPLILPRNRSRIEANVETLRSFTQQHHDNLALHPLKAGAMALVEQRTPLTSVQLCERLLNDERVFLVPGEAMGMSDRLLRFGLGRNDFAQGLKRFGKFLQRGGS